MSYTRTNLLIYPLVVVFCFFLIHTYSALGREYEICTQSLGKQISFIQRLQGKSRKLEHELMVRREKGREWFKRGSMFSKPYSGCMFMYSNRKEKRGALFITWLYICPSLFYQCHEDIVNFLIIFTNTRLAGIKKYY